MMLMIYIHTVTVPLINTIKEVGATAATELKRRKVTTHLTIIQIPTGVLIVIRAVIIIIVIRGGMMIIERMKGREIKAEIGRIK